MQPSLTKDILQNPHTGDRLIITRDTASTGGAYLEVEAIYQPSKAFAPEHFHPAQEEHFTVLSGKLMTRINGVVREYKAGESFTISHGTPHGMYNASTGEVHFRWKITPALRTEFFFRSIYAAAGKANGQPGVAAVLWILKDFQKEIVVTKIPPLLQPFIFRFILPLFGKNYMD